MAPHTGTTEPGLLISNPAMTTPNTALTISNTRKITIEKMARARGPTTSPVRVPTDFALDRKSTRLNSSHVRISYAVFCLKKKSCAQNLLGRRCQQVVAPADRRVQGLVALGEVSQRPLADQQRSRELLVNLRDSPHVTSGRRWQGRVAIGEVSQRPRADQQRSRELLVKLSESPHVTSGRRELDRQR